MLGRGEERAESKPQTRNRDVPLGSRETAKGPDRLGRTPLANHASAAPRFAFGSVNRLQILHQEMRQEGGGREALGLWNEPTQRPREATNS